MILSRRDQALLILLMVLVCGFLFYRFTYAPLKHEIGSITVSNQQLQTEKQNLQKQIKKGPAKIEDTVEEHAYLDKVLPAQDEMIHLLTMLDETTAKHGLPFTSLDYKGAEKPDATGARTLVFNISTKGKIMQLLDLLNDLEKAERLISVEDVAFNAVKAEKEETEVEEGLTPPTYYIAPPGIPEAKLQRIKFEVGEEKETEADAETLVAESFMMDNFEMKITIKTYYAAPPKAAPAKEKINNKPTNDASNTKGEV